MSRLNPVLARELSTRMRGGRGSAVITGNLMLLSAAALVLLVAQSAPSTHAAAATLGSRLFSLLASVGMVNVIFVSTASTAEAIGDERQRQTLDLLLVTRLRATDIVLGKLGAGLAFNLLLLVCALPIFGLAFVYGGMDIEQVVGVFVIFLATSLLLASLGLFVSTLVRRSGVPTMVSLICALLLTVGLTSATTSTLDLSTFNFFGYAGTPMLAQRGSLDPSLSLPAYLDPLTGFYSALIGFGAGTVSGGAVAYSNPFGRELWIVQAGIDLLGALVLVLGSIRQVRHLSIQGCSRVRRPAINRMQRARQRGYT